jgi:hypothetical protein
VRSGPFGWAAEPVPRPPEKSGIYHPNGSSNNDKPRLKLNPACEILTDQSLIKTETCGIGFYMTGLGGRVSAGKKAAMRVEQIAEGPRQEEIFYLNRS